MKIRIQDDQVTLRITTNEIDELSQKGIIRSVTRFPNKTLYTYLETVDIPEPSVDFNDEGLIFLFPEEEIEKWSASHKVGYRSSVSDILLVIEKDLPKRKSS
jgi:hypothetical protein